ncbi:MAG: LysM peptidoglycan-binding domain-containing protein [Clostridia bacterium]|nr:LysM peptidoglycan-binding domain-containing protein [Clostridia bacterium]
MITHKVKKGETLSEIAKKYGTSVEAIRMVNSERIKNVNDICIGWTLVIPNTPKPSENVKTYYEKVGRAFDRAIADIKKLDSVKELESLLNN